jgi:hypothetical protein
MAYNRRRTFYTGSLAVALSAMTVSSSDQSDSPVSQTGYLGRYSDTPAVDGYRADSTRQVGATAAPTQPVGLKPRLGLQAESVPHTFGMSR